MTTAQSDPVPPAPPADPPQGNPSVRARVDAYFRSFEGRLALWTGVLGGAVAWSLQMIIGYAVSRFSHGHRWLTAVHHLVSLLGVLAAAAAAYIAWLEWQRLGAGEPGGTEAGVTGRSRFLAALGIVCSAYFAVVILAQWVPVFFWDPGWY
jgi:hypothetical protein